MKSNLKFALFAFGLMVALSFRPLPKQDQQPQQQKYYYIRFTADELNQVLNAEAQLPYVQSAGIISNIQQQVQQQDSPVRPKTDSTKNKKQ